MHLSLLILGKIIFIFDVRRGCILGLGCACIQVLLVLMYITIDKIRVNAVRGVIYLALLDKNLLRHLRFSWRRKILLSWKIIVRSCL